MLSYHGTSTFTGYGSTRSLTQTGSGTAAGTASPPLMSYTRHRTQVDTSYTRGQATESYSNHSGTTSMAATEIGYDTTYRTFSVTSTASRNETGRTHGVTTWGYTDEVATALASITSTASFAELATSMRLTTTDSLATTSANTTTTHTTTTAGSMTRATLTDTGAGTETTTMTTATNRSTTATSATTTSSKLTTTTAISRGASVNVFTIYEATTDEVLIRGPATSGSTYTNDFSSRSRGQPVNTDRTTTSASRLSFLPGAVTTASFTVPAALVTSTLTTATLGTASHTFSALTSETTTASIAASADAGASTSITLSRWSTTTTGSSHRLAQTGTTTATYAGTTSAGTDLPTAQLATFTLSVVTTASRSVWGHGLGLTATTYAVHGIVSNTSITTRTGFGTASSTWTTTASTLMAASHTHTTTSTFATPAPFCTELSLATGDFSINFPDAGQALGVTYTIEGRPARTSFSHTIGSQHAAHRQEPSILPGRQPASAFAASDDRYLALTISADGAATTASAYPPAGTMHYDSRNTTASSTLGGAASAASIAEARQASYSETNGFTFTTRTENFTDTITTAGMGGYEAKRPSFSELAALSAGCWHLTTQEGTTTGTTTAAYTALTGSSGKRTALEPVASISFNSFIAEPFGSFKTTQNA